MRLALFEPDIPQNLGAFIRLSACLKVPLDVIEPCGFPVDDKRIRRAAMDYYDLASIARHASWAAFKRDLPAGRLVLLTTKGATDFPGIAFAKDDTLLFGSETAGAPDHVHAAADARVVIPIRPGARSMNLSVSAGIGLFEGLRQTGGLRAV